MDVIFYLQAIVVASVCYGGNGIPVIKYNPKLYYGPMINEAKYTAHPDYPTKIRPENQASTKAESERWNKNHFRSRRHSDDLDYYQDTFSSPEFQNIIPSFQYDEDVMDSPQLQTALETYFREKYGPESGSRNKQIASNEDTMMYPFMPMKDFSNQNLPPVTSNRRTLSIIKSPDAKEEDDYDYAEVDAEPVAEDEDADDSQSNRRTFSLIGGAIMSMMNGNGATEEEVRVEAQLRAQERQAQLLREVQETNQLEQLKTQATLDSLREESNQNTLRNRAQVESLNAQIARLAEQRENERREKESIRAQIENESRLREREKDELHRKLELEATMRERENQNMQQRLQQEAAMRDIETYKMQKQFELERAKLDFELRNKMEIESRQEMQKREMEAKADELQKRMEMDTIMQNNLMKSSYESLMNQQTINNYRSSGMGPATLTPPLLAPSPPYISMGPGNSMFIHP